MNNILYIKTKDKNYFQLAIYQKDKIYSKKYHVKTGEMSKVLLKQIIRFLKTHDINIQKLEKIFVYIGPGSYTSLRVGILTANTIAWSINKPIISLKKDSKYRPLPEITGL